ARVHAHVRPGKKIRLSAPQFGIDSYGTWEGGTFELEKESPSSVFSKNAVQSALEYLDFKKISIQPFELETRSDAAFTQGGGKSGLGSSAAVTVAIVSSLLDFHGVSDLHQVHRCAQVAHSRGQGKVGSGYDIAACCFGSQEYKRYTPTLIEGYPENAEKPWDYFVRSLPLPSFFHIAMAAFPQEGTSTVSMTKHVKAWKEKDPKAYGTLMRELNEANVNAMAYLEELERGRNRECLEKFRTYFENTWNLTAELGRKSGAPIEPKEVKEIIDMSLQNGAFVCKSPGAGVKDALAALCLDAKDKKGLDAFWESSGLTVLNVSADNAGVK
ncbi:MAG TPA: hypothetical protein VI874_05270, partial [Candidatus Norongarragalinales archaeon]|nr:hypothetical protein [Candidatus Norongarragalinales archaeon]